MHELKAPHTSRLLRAHTSAHSSRGFSLVELLITVAIVGVLAAIALPLAISQQARAADATTKAALTAAASTVEQRLLEWRGAPPEALNICHTAVTYPTANAPTNTCADTRWTTTKSSDNGTLTPALGGTVSEGVLLQGRIAADGSYCLDGSHSRTGTSAYRFMSGRNTIEMGTCFQAGWTSVASKTGTGGATVGATPSEPTGVITDINAISRSVTVKWDALAGNTYTVKIDGQPAKSVTATTTGQATCVFPANTCAGPVSGTLTAGPYTATVRAGTAAGVSAASTSDFSVPSAEQTGTQTVLNMGGSHPAPVATVDGSRMNFVPNPSFEINTDDWAPTGSGTIVEIASGGKIGLNALRVIKAAVAYAGAIQTTKMDVAANASYLASAYVRVPTGQPDAPLRLRLHEYKANGSQNASAISATTTVTSADGWVRLELAKTPAAGTTTMRIAVEQASVGANGAQFLIDGVMLEQTSVLKSYFDGDSVNAFWASVKHNSPSIMNLSSSARGRVKVSWVEPPKASGVDVLYTVTSDPDQVTCSIVSATACYVENLEDDTDYTFKVKATTDGGSGSVGTSNMVRTPPAPARAATIPTKPLNVQAVPDSNGRITLTWDSPADSGGSAVEDFIIEVQNGGAWQEINDGVSPAKTYTSPAGLTRDQYYTYRVTAVNVAGKSPASDTTSSTPGYPPLTPTVVAEPWYQLSTQNAKMSVAAQAANSSGEVTYITGYSTSSGITTPGALASGTAGTTSCTSTTCTFTWPNMRTKLGTRQYFYVFAQNDMGTAPVLRSSPGVPMADVVTHAANSTALGCPPGYTTDLGNGYCRAYAPYTYHQEARTGSRWVSTSTCYAACSGSGSPCGSPCCCWGGSPAAGGWICCSGGGYWSNYTYYVTVKDNKPGWVDYGSGWYQDARKINKSTWVVTSALPYGDAAAAAKKFGRFFVRGTEETDWRSADLGLCPGGVSYELWGLGGKTTGTYTPPCNN